MAVEHYLLSLLVAPLLYVVIKCVSSLRHSWTMRAALNEFGKENHHWLMGHLGEHTFFTHEGLLKNNDCVTKHPRYYAFYAGPFRTHLVLNHPDTVKEITKTAEPKALSGGGYSFISPWIGDGLLVSTGQK